MLDGFWRGIGKFTYRFRYALLILFIALFAGAAYFQNFTPLFYTTPRDPNLVNALFPEDDLFVVVYENAEEAAALKFQTEAKKDERIQSVTSYQTSFNTPFTADELTEQFTVGPVTIGSLLVDAVYYLYENQGSFDTANPYDLFLFMTSDSVWADAAVSGSFTAAQKEEIFSIAALLDKLKTGAPLSVQETERLSRLTDEEKDILTLAVSSSPFLSDEFASELFPKLAPTLSPSHVHVFYALYLGHAKGSSIKLTITQAFDYLSGELAKDDRFSALMTDEVKMILRLGTIMIQTGKDKLVGDNYSRIVFYVTPMAEPSEINAFFDEMKALAEEHFEKEYYFVGDTAMSYEISGTFQREFLTISVLISAAIFLIILLTFKKLSVPLILVCAIECAAFTGMSVLYFIGTPVYFIAIIVVQGVLMGSTVDYGILLSSYYKECRILFDKDRAIAETLKRSAPTFLTSGIILVIVTLYLGAITTGAVASILTMVGVGSLAATLLVLFVLPALLTLFDKFV